MSNDACQNLNMPEEMIAAHDAWHVGNFLNSLSLNQTLTLARAFQEAAEDTLGHKCKVMISTSSKLRYEEVEIGNNPNQTFDYPVGRERTDTLQDRVTIVPKRWDAAELIDISLFHSEEAALAGSFFATMSIDKRRFPGRVDFYMENSPPSVERAVHQAHGKRLSLAALFK